MILLILVALWIVVLAPAFVKKWLDRRSTVSIDTFHQQLHLLERAGPKLVPPAYRLETAQSATGMAVGASGFPAVSSRPSRPNLVLLQAVGEGEAGVVADGGPGGEVVDDASGAHYRRLAPAHVLDEGPSRRLARAQVEAFRRHTVQRRRRDLLIGMVVTLVLSGLLGLAVSLFWVVTVVAALALAGYVGLAAYAQLLEADRRGPAAPADGYGWLSATDAGGRGPGAREVAGQGGPAAAATDRWMATVGYPGAWDDEDGSYEEPREAAAR
ncbi:MAG: hypothetical protein ACRDZR_10090 [Acidimicrobiales bacterium]